MINVAILDLRTNDAWNYDWALVRRSYEYSKHTHDILYYDPKGDYVLFDGSEDEAKAYFIEYCTQHGLLLVEYETLEGLDVYEKQRLKYMPDYHIERDAFNKIIEETIGYDYLLDAFCYGQFNNTDSFAWFRIGDEFYIIHTDSGMMINWYKHTGRTNTCSQSNRTIEDYYEFFNRFKEELKDFYEEKKR